MEMGIQDISKSIGDNGCLAFVYANVVESLADGWDAKKPACQLKLLADVIDGMYSGILGEDCFVTSAGKFMSYLDNGKHDFKVEKVDLDGTVKDLAGKIAAVHFAYTDVNGAKRGHWCLFAGKEIVFDSLKSSQSRRLGKPDTARIITISTK